MANLIDSRPGPWDQDREILPVGPLQYTVGPNGSIKFSQVPTKKTLCCNDLNTFSHGSCYYNRYEKIVRIGSQEFKKVDSTDNLRIGRLLYLFKHINYRDDMYFLVKVLSSNMIINYDEYSSNYYNLQTIRLKYIHPEIQLEEEIKITNNMLFCAVFYPSSDTNEQVIALVSAIRNRSINLNVAKIMISYLNCDKCNEIVSYLESILFSSVSR